MNTQQLATRRVSTAIGKAIGWNVPSEFVGYAGDLAKYAKCATTPMRRRWAERKIRCRIANVALDLGLSVDQVKLSKVVTLLLH